MRLIGWCFCGWDEIAPSLVCRFIVEMPQKGVGEVCSDGWSEEGALGYGGTLNAVVEAYPCRIRTTATGNRQSNESHIDTVGWREKQATSWG